MSCEFAAKLRVRGEKRKTSGYLGLESHFHADTSCQTRQIDNYKRDQCQLSNHASPRYYQKNEPIISICVFLKISTNPSLCFRSWRLHESEIQVQGNQSLFSFSSRRFAALSRLSRGSRKTSGTRVEFRPLLFKMATLTEYQNCKQAKLLRGLKETRQGNA